MFAQKKIKSIEHTLLQYIYQRKHVKGNMLMTCKTGKHRTALRELSPDKRISILVLNNLENGSFKNRGKLDNLKTADP